MKRLHRPVAAAAILLAATAIAAEEKPMERIFPYDAHVETLDNGLRVILVPMSSEGLVAYWSIVRTGSRDEYEPGRTGFAHFFEHMMFQGTENVDQEMYNASVTRMGADANAYTSTDLTAYHLGITAGDLEETMKLESDRFQNLSYSAQDFETEAGAVYGEYRKNRMNPFFTVWEAVHENAFDRHTYGHTTMGYEKDIKAMPGMFDYSRSFFSRYYRPDNVVLLIVGDVEVSNTMGLVRKYYGDWKAGYKVPEVPAEPVQTKERRIDVEYKGKTLPIVWLAYKAGRFDPGDEMWVATRLLAELAFGETSDIYKKLVLEEQAVEFIAAELGYSRDPGLFNIYARVKDADRVDAVVAEIDSVVERYRENPPDAERLAALKARLKYGFLMGLDTPDRVASGLARLIAITGGIDAVDELYAAYDRITPEAVQKAAREHLVSARRTVAELGDGPMKGTLVATLAVGALVGLAGCAGLTGDEEGLVLLRVPDDPTVTFKVWFQVGSQNDPPGKEGLAFLTGELVADGSTEKRSYEEILEQLYPLASSYGIRVDREMTVMTGRTHKDNLDLFYELFTDAYLQPAFRDDDFSRIKGDVLNYLQNTLRFASDEELGKAALQSVLFEGTTYAHPPHGTVQGVESITLDDVRGFYRRHFTRENAIVALGGGFDDDLVDRSRASLSQLSEGRPEKMAAPSPVALDGSRALLVAKPDADASISFGCPIDVRRGDREFYALWVANSWLGEHRNSVSRLFQVIREERGLNYGDYSYIEAFPEGGRRQFPPSHVGRSRPVFEVWIRTLPDEQGPFALRAALRELDSLIENGMTEEQFELSRAFLKKYALHFADTTAGRLGYAVDDRFFGIEGEGHLERFRRMMDELTLDEVNAAVRKHLRIENLGFGIVTGDAEAWKKVLAEGGATPIEYATPKPESVTAEDGEIASFPLHVEHVAVRPVEEIFEE